MKVNLILHNEHYELNFDASSPRRESFLYDSCTLVERSASRARLATPPEYYFKMCHMQSQRCLCWYIYIYIYIYIYVYIYTLGVCVCVCVWVCVCVRVHVRVRVCMLVCL